MLSNRREVVENISVQHYNKIENEWPYVFVTLVGLLLVILSQSNFQMIDE